MECIADSLGISKRTLYQCFRNKRELLEECVTDCIEVNQRLIREKTGSSGNMEAMIIMCNEVYGLLASLYPAFRRDIICHEGILELLRDKYRTFLYDWGNKFFERAKAEKFILEESNFGLVFSFFENYLLSLSISIREDKIQFAAYNHTLITYLAGICTHSGREKLTNISIENCYEKD